MQYKNLSLFLKSVLANLLNKVRLFRDSTARQRSNLQKRQVISYHEKIGLVLLTIYRKRVLGQLLYFVE